MSFSFKGGELLLRTSLQIIGIQFPSALCAVRGVHQLPILRRKRWRFLDRPIVCDLLLGASCRIHNNDLAAVILPISKSDPACKGRRCRVLRNPWRGGEDDNGAGCRDGFCYEGESLRGDEIEKGRMDA